LPQPAAPGWIAIDQFPRWIVRGVGLSNASVSRDREMNIYVGNLPYSVTNEDLESAFAAFGDVSSATVIMDKMTGRSKGFGFVEMPNQDEAQAALKALDGSDMGGRNVKVNEARPREDRPRRDSPRY
jgi:RNA recognition motif-containing protein